MISLCHHLRYTVVFLVFFCIYKVLAHYYELFNFKLIIALVGHAFITTTIYAGTESFWIFVFRQVVVRCPCSPLRQDHKRMLLRHPCLTA